MTGSFLVGMMILYSLQRCDFMKRNLRSFVMSLLIFILVIGCILPVIQLPVSAKTDDEIPLPFEYFSAQGEERSLDSEGRIGFDFSYKSYPQTEVNKYIKQLEKLGLEAGKLNKLINGDRTCTVRFNGDTCVKFNYDASDDVLTVFLYVDDLKKAGFRIEQEKNVAMNPNEDLDYFFGTAFWVEDLKDRTKYSYLCSGYPRSQIEDYSDHLKDYGVKAGTVVKKLNGNRTQKFTLDGDVCIEIIWIEKEYSLDIYIYDVLGVGVDEQTGATPTVNGGMCVECGEVLGEYDGYCYYCHPDFMFLCKRCGCLWPSHRTEDNMCPPCSEAIQNGEPKIIAKPKVSLDNCMECGEAGGEYDGYCYYCHPDFLFICKECGCLWPAHRTEDNLCPPCMDKLANKSEDEDSETYTQKPSLTTEETVSVGEDQTIRVKKGQKVKLKSKYTESAGAKVYTWSVTSGSNVINIDGVGRNCNVTALKKGTATVKLQYQYSYWGSDSLTGNRRQVNTTKTREYTIIVE